jgi:TolA-binding protein
MLVGAAGICGCGPTKKAEDQAAFDDGFTAFQAGQWQRAADGFTRYLRASPQSPQRGEVYYYRGEAMAHLGRRQDALADFRRAIVAQPPQPIEAFARVAIGNIYYEAGDDAKAVEAYSEALRGPQDQLPMDSLLLRVGVSLQRLGNWTSGDKYLGMLIDRYPDSSWAAEGRRRIRVGGFSVQTGAFASLAAAQAEAERLRAAGFRPILADAKRGTQVLHSVRVGKVRTYLEATYLVGQLTGAGFSALIVP